MVRRVRALIVVAAAALVVVACTTKKTQQPPLTGPSELALALNLTASPDILTQDGKSQSFIVILARDANGTPVKGLPLRVTFTVSSQGALLDAGQLSSQDVTTGSDGRATVSYTAAPLPPDGVDRDTIVTVLVTPTGTDYANALPRTVQIRLVPPGIVSPGPIAGFTFSPVLPVVDSPVTFDGTSSSSQSGTIVSWAWDFGDGPVFDGETKTRGPSPGSGARPQHVYREAGTFTVTLAVMDSTGRTSIVVTQLIRISAATPLTAAFVSSPSEPAVGQTVFFNASTSVAGTGRTIVDYAWNFGNGTTGRGVNVTAKYAAAATYKVTLVVTDDIGRTASTVGDVTVK